MWEESCVGGIPSGWNPVWEESHVGGILCGRNPMWEESCVGGIPFGRNPVGRSPVGGILLGGVPWEESCWEEFHDNHNIDMRENLKFDWIDTVKTTDRDLKNTVQTRFIIFSTFCFLTFCSLIFMRRIRIKNEPW